MPVQRQRCFSPPPRFQPPLDRWPEAGVYQLWLRVSVGVCVTVGRLGRFWFPPGRYVYTGRASRGLRSRIRRHVRGGRRRRWHVDYLLSCGEVGVERVVLASLDPDDECRVNQTATGRGGLFIFGFGASDCRWRCGSHLRLMTLDAG